MKRITQIDCIRGLMLVIMTVDHLQYMAFSRLSEHTINFTYQTFGFVAAVEGFVFLSGLVFGLVYTPKLINDESNFNRVVWRRWRLIYYYHLGLLLILATLFSIPWFAQIWSHPWSNIALLHTEPWWSAATGAVFLYQPSYLDILPMYLAFVALSPLVLRMLQQNRAKLLAVLSIACYLAVQIFHPQFVLSASLSDFGFYLGWFELLSWQLLFFGGVWLGFAHKKNPNFRIPIKRQLDHHRGNNRRAINVVSPSIQLTLRRATILRRPIPRPQPRHHPHNKRGGIRLSFIFPMPRQNRPGYNGNG